MERPAFRRLLADVQAKKVDCVLVYKVDRLSRSIRDFAKIMEILEKHGTTFVSVTQQFNTTTSLGRLTLNILLSFAASARLGQNSGRQKQECLAHLHLFCCLRMPGRRAPNALPVRSRVPSHLNPA
jgi:DNA invertase Pin-like site-specific DNA recombinase